MWLIGATNLGTNCRCSVLYCQRTNTPSSPPDIMFEPETTRTTVSLTKAVKLKTWKFFWPNSGHLIAQKRSAAQKYCSISFSWMVTLRVLNIESKVQMTFHITVNSTTGKHCSVPFFEWSHFRISSTDLKVRTTSYSIINSTTGTYCSKLSLNGHTLGSTSTD